MRATVGLSRGASVAVWSIAIILLVMTVAVVAASGARGVQAGDVAAGTPGALSEESRVSQASALGQETDPAQRAAENISNWMRGMNITNRWSEFYAYSEFQAAVDDIAQTSANFVVLDIPLEQTSYESADVGPFDLTPPDSALIAGIEYAHSQSLQVMLLPSIDIVQGVWQARINPENRAEWFRNYGAALLHYAELAEEHGVEVLAIGSELRSLTSHIAHPDNTESWRRLISDIREVYSGELTYGGQWGPEDESARTVEFWDDLDYIGIAAYFNLPSQTNAVEDIEAQWDRLNREYIRPLHERFDRPVVFTEIGYRNQQGARFEPWTNRDTEPDEVEQANLYEAVLSYWSQQDHFGGMFWWEWRDDLPEDNVYYTPNGKLAEEVLTRWFGMGASHTPDEG